MTNLVCLWVPQFPWWALGGDGVEPYAVCAGAVCDRGRVVALSPAALDRGVEVGWTSGRAVARCSELQLFERDCAREALAWAEVERAFYGLTPQLESVEPGLLFAEIKGEDRLREGLLPLVRLWKAQAGVAGDRASALLAALSTEAGRVRVVRARHEARFADKIPLSLLAEVGVSDRSIERLAWFGWNTVGALRALSRRQLEEQVGEDGARLYLWAQGPKARENRRPVPTWTPPSEVSARMTFELPAREPGEWEEALCELLRQVCEELRGQSAHTLEVEVETVVGPLVARRVMREATACPRTLERPAHMATLEALALLQPLAPVALGLEVRLGGLTTPEVQTSLFPEEKQTRRGHLRRAVEAVERRFAGRTGTFAPAEVHSPFPEDLWKWRGALDALAEERNAAVPRKRRRA